MDVNLPSSEYIELTNTGAQNVALSGWTITVPPYPAEPGGRFTFGNGTVLEPGLTCRVFTGVASGTGGGTSNACAGLSLGKNASLYSRPAQIDLKDTNGVLMAVYVIPQ